MSRIDQLAGTHLAPDPTDLARLLSGAHYNPHAILGAHEYGDCTVIRAFRPHAREVVALVGKDRYPLQHIESGRARQIPRTVELPRRERVENPPVPRVHVTGIVFTSVGNSQSERASSRLDLPAARQGLGYPRGKL